jgi:hypothetical protein
MDPDPKAYTFIPFYTYQDKSEPLFLYIGFRTSYSSCDWTFGPCYDPVYACAPPELPRYYFTVIVTNERNKGYYEHPSHPKSETSILGTARDCHSCKYHVTKELFPTIWESIACSLVKPNIPLQSAVMDFTYTKITTAESDPSAIKDS